MENYLKMVPAAGMMQKGEIFSKSWYFNICFLRPLDSKERFSRIHEYFCKTESVSLVKSGEDILLIMSDRKFTENTDSVPRRLNLHCFVLSKTSKLVRGKETAFSSDSRIDPANDFFEKPPKCSLIESGKLEESFSSYYEQLNNEIDMCDKQTIEKKTRQEKATSCKRDSHEEKRKASNRTEPKERKRHKTDNSQSISLSRDKGSSKGFVNSDVAESKRKRHKSEKIRRKDVEMVHETKSVNLGSHVLKSSGGIEKSERFLICEITDSERLKSVECVINSETTPIEKKSEADTKKKRTSETVPDSCGLKKAKLPKVNETGDNLRDQQDKKIPSKKKVSKISVMEKKQMESEKVLSTLNLSHCKENVRSLGRIPKKKSITERDIDASKLKLSPGKVTSTSVDKKDPPRASDSSGMIKLSKEEIKHEIEKSRKKKKSYKEKERDMSEISVDEMINAIKGDKTHTCKKESNQDFNSNKNHMPEDCLQNVSNNDENAKKQSLQISSYKDKTNKSCELETSSKDGERISQESELTYERDGREDLFMLDDSPRTKSLPVINVQDQLCKLKSWTDEDKLLAPYNSESKIPGFGDLDLLKDFKEKKLRTTTLRKIEKTDDGLLVQRNVKDAELGIWSRILEFSDFFSQALHSFPKSDGSHTVDKCPFRKAVAYIHQKTFASGSNRAITLDPSDPCVINITVHVSNLYNQSITNGTRNDAQLHDGTKLQKMERPGAHIASEVPLTRSSPRNKVDFSKNINTDKSFVINELDREVALTNSTQNLKNTPYEYSSDAFSFSSGNVVDENTVTDAIIKSCEDDEADKINKNFTEVNSEEDSCWNLAIKPVSRDITQDCLSKLSQPENKTQTSKLTLQGIPGDTELKGNPTKLDHLENGTTVKKDFARKDQDISFKTALLIGTQLESRAETVIQQKSFDKKLKDDLSRQRNMDIESKSTKAVLEPKVCEEKSKNSKAVLEPKVCEEKLKSTKAVLEPKVCEEKSKSTKAVLEQKVCEEKSKSTKAVLEVKVCEEKSKSYKVLLDKKVCENKFNSAKEETEQKACDKKLKDCQALRKQIENKSNVGTTLMEKGWHKKIEDNMVKTRQTENAEESAKMKAKIAVSGKDTREMKDVQKQSKSKEKIKKADGKSEKLDNKVKVSSSSGTGDKKALNKEGSIQQRLEKISEQKVPEEMKTKKNEKRQARQYHPYKKEPKPMRPKKPTWSFDIAYSDMEELLQNLTENMFKIDGRSSADIRRWRKGTNKSGLCSGRGRFCGFRFNRSEIPDSLPKFTETVLSEDDYKINPELISNLEERARQADIVEESWQNELEEESVFNDEMCVYTQDKDQNAAEESSNLKAGNKKTTLILPGMGKSSMYSSEDLGDAFHSSKEFIQKSDLHLDHTELPAPQEKRDISSEKQCVGDLESKIKTEDIAVKIEFKNNNKHEADDDKRVAILRASSCVTDKDSSTSNIDDCSKEKKMAETTNISASEDMKDTAKTSQPVTEIKDAVTSHKQEEEFDLENKRDKSPDHKELKILSSDSEVCLDWTDDEVLSERGADDTDTDEETFVVIDKLEDCHVDSSKDNETERTETKQSLTSNNENLDRSKNVSGTLHQKSDDHDKGNDRFASGSCQTEEQESSYVYDPDLYHTSDEVSESEHTVLGNNDLEEVSGTKSDIQSDTGSLQNETSSMQLKRDHEMKCIADSKDAAHFSCERTSEPDNGSQRPSIATNDQQGENSTVQDSFAAPKEEGKVAGHKQLADAQKATTESNTGEGIEVSNKDSFHSDVKTKDNTSYYDGKQVVSQIKPGCDPSTSLPTEIDITSNITKNLEKDLKSNKMSTDCDISQNNSELNVPKEIVSSQQLESAGSGEVRLTYKSCKITNSSMKDKQPAKPIDLHDSLLQTKECKTTGKSQIGTSQISSLGSYTSEVNKDNNPKSHITSKKQVHSFQSTSPNFSSSSSSFATKTAGSPYNNQYVIDPGYQHYHQYFRPFPWNRVNQSTFSPNSQYPGYGLMYPPPPLPTGNPGYTPPTYSHTQSTIQPYYSGMYNYPVPTYPNTHLNVNFNVPFYSQMSNSMQQVPQISPMQTNNLDQSQNRNMSPPYPYTDRYSR